MSEDDSGDGSLATSRGDGGIENFHGPFGFHGRRFMYIWKTFVPTVSAILRDNP